MLEKVVCLITRPAAQGKQLLLIRHPYAGVQIPAGTVEPGELPEAAALREAGEETGLAALAVVRRLAVREERLKGERRAVLRPTTVYARPDPGSFAWARLPFRTRVRLRRSVGEFSQVSYVEWDEYPARHYISYQITGWVRSADLAGRIRRHFFLLHPQFATPEQLPAVQTDKHLFQPFWAPLDDLPQIVARQAGWLDHLRDG